MIVPMHKVTVVCLESDRTSALDTLGELGVLHLIAAREPAAPDLDRLRTESARLDRAAQALSARVEEAAADLPPDDERNTDAVSASNRVLELDRERADLEARRTELAHLRRRLTPFGAFERERLARLESAGVSVRLCIVPARQPLRAPAGAVVRVLSRSASGDAVAIIGRGEIDCGDAQPFELPDLSLRQVEAEDRRLEERGHAIDGELCTLAGMLPALSRRATLVREQIAFAEARAGMRRAGGLAYLQGFCPVADTGALRGAAARNGWGLLVREPAREDATPTLIRYARWTRPVKALFDFLGILPGYRENDVSPAFLVFLSLFFAIIVGDAGYALLLLLLTFWLQSRSPKRFADALRLLAIFLSTTLVWGILTANYFGLPAERLPRVLRLLQVAWLTDRDHSMTFCLGLGAVHLTVAHAWNALRSASGAKVLAQAGWIGVTWSLFAGARTLLLQVPFPAPFAVVFILSASAVLVALLLQKAWARLPTLPQDLVADFGDLMSYLRLFALGIASVKVAEAFNDMAGMIGYGNLASILGALLVLLLGHSLNIVLCALSVLVHGVRLNALEFSLHMEQEWTGAAYRPFIFRAATDLDSRNGG